jgi:hypothetical protein
MASLGFAAVVIVVSAILAYDNYTTAKAALDSPGQHAIAAATNIDSKYMKCIVPLSDAADAIRECTFGDADSSETIALVGDSHAWQWIPALEEIATRDHFKLVTIIRSRCPVPSVSFFDHVLRRETICAEWRNMMLQRVQQLTPKMVIAGSSYDYMDTEIQVSQWGEGTRVT